MNKNCQEPACQSLITLGSFPERGLDSVSVSLEQALSDFSHQHQSSQRSQVQEVCKLSIRFSNQDMIDDLEENSFSGVEEVEELCCKKNGSE